MESIITLFLWLVLFSLMLAAGYIAFIVIERNREKYLAEREKALAHITVTDLKMVPELRNAERAQLVAGTVTVANNYFLTICASFKTIFGGEMKGYTLLCTAARRIALVRLKEEAEKIGATSVCCLRYETMVIQQSQYNQKAPGGVELLAYGTAIIPRPE